MKIPKEQIFILIIGLFLLSYLLEAIVDPLTLKLSTPYAYLSPIYFAKYPFTTATVIIRALSLFLTPVFLFSFISKNYFTKVVVLLVIGVLAQLYSVQEIATGTTLIPLEWSLSLSIAGAALIIPIIINILTGIFFSTKAKFSKKETVTETPTETDENH